MSDIPGFVQFDVLAATRAARASRARRREPTTDQKRPSTEADLLRFVRKTAEVYGFRTYHTLYSPGSDRGFPDLVMVRARDGRLIVAELKGPRGRVTDEQWVWLHTFANVKGAEVYLWTTAHDTELIHQLIANGPAPCEAYGEVRP